MCKIKASSGYRYTSCAGVKERRCFCLYLSHAYLHHHPEDHQEHDDHGRTMPFRWCNCCSIMEQISMQKAEYMEQHLQLL